MSRFIATVFLVPEDKSIAEELKNIYEEGWRAIHFEHASTNWLIFAEKEITE